MTISEHGPELIADEDLMTEELAGGDLDLHIYGEDEIQSDGSQIEEQPLAESMEGHDPEDSEELTEGGDE